MTESHPEFESAKDAFAVRLSTFEGPLMSIRTVNALSHYTDWTVGHVHSGALGWVGMISMGCMYHLIPRLWGKKEVYSLKLVSWHVWLATLGIVVYAITPMLCAGVRARGLDPDFPADALAQVEALSRAPTTSQVPVRDLRGLLWCSIDNDDSLDLDQLTVAGLAGDEGAKILVAIADVVRLHLEHQRRQGFGRVGAAGERPTGTGIGTRHRPYVQGRGQKIHHRIQ